MKVEDLIDNPLDEILEAAPAGSTSVQTLGSLEWTASPSMIKLYKRDEALKPCCIAKIRRKPHSGWRFITTQDWKKFDLPHFGNLKDIRTDVNGKKTISGSLPVILKQWGISVGDLKRMEVK